MSGLISLKDVEGVAGLDPIRFCIVLTIMIALGLEIYTVVALAQKFDVVQFCVAMGGLLFGGGAAQAIRRDVRPPSMPSALRRDDV